MANGHVQARCVACHGEAHPGDDHPKVHTMGLIMEGPGVDGVLDVTPPKSYHFDCLPDAYLADLVGPQHARTIQTRRAAIEGGLRGDALRAYNATLPDDNNVAADA